MAIRSRFLPMVGMLLVGSMAAANSFREMPLEERVVESELVVVADFVAPASCPEDSGRWCADGRYMATFRVRNSLKGEVQDGEIVVQCRTNVPEGSPEACDPGRYILFLERSRAGHWIIVGGPYGALNIR